MPTGTVLPGLSRGPMASVYHALAEVSRSRHGSAADLCLARQPAQAQSSTHLAVGLLGALCTPDPAARLGALYVGTVSPTDHYI